MQVTTGGLDLLESITFISLSLGESKIKLGNTDEFIDFIFEFVENKNNESETLSYTPINDQTLKITLSNWNNVLGTTLIDPVKVGSFRNRELYIHFFVKKAGQKGQCREVTFCTFLGKEVQNG